MERFVPIADVVKAIGLRGEVKLYPLLDFHAPLLATGFLRWDDGETAPLESARPAGTGVAVRPRGCMTRDEAERLVGRQLGFDREAYLDAAFPRPDEGLPFRYLDREVRTRDGELLGCIQEVRRYAAQILLVIDRAGREVMIPAVEPIVEVDDAIAGPVVADPPEGLLDA
jgi:16S rRNA processing protein RimM